MDFMVVLGTAIVPSIAFFIVFIIVIVRIVKATKNNKSIINEEFTGENSEFIDLIKNGLKGENPSKKSHKCEYCGSIHSGTKCPNCGATRTE